MNVHLNNIAPPGSSAFYGYRVLVFKTNLRMREAILAVGRLLDQHTDIRRWNVDRHDIDNVLRIETRSLTAEEVIDLVRQAGYCCEELPD